MLIEFCDCVAFDYLERDYAFDTEEENIREQLRTVEGFLNEVPKENHYSFDKYSALYCRLNDDLAKLYSARLSFYKCISSELLDKMFQYVQGPDSEYEENSESSEEV